MEALVQRTGLPEFTRTTHTTPQALFADLERIRQRSWALDDEERYAGMRCVAAAIWDARGRAVAGLSVSGPTVRFPHLVIAEVGPQVRRAAAEITRRLGGEPRLADVARYRVVMNKAHRDVASAPTRPPLCEASLAGRSIARRFEMRSPQCKPV